MILLSATFLFHGFLAGYATQEEAQHVRPWPQEVSDIPADPAIHFGALENGLRYAWERNERPKKRTYLRLHVDAGSLAEEEDERGMAHFLEHMAFNGSRNFEPGKLIDWFQAHGMDFGADTNAQTAWSWTVYQIDLPNSDEASLREGLRVLRDFADGLLLAPEEIESEKGVIDGEERESDSAGMRLFRRNNEILFAGTRLPVRDPIGVEEIRCAFDAAALRRFYAKWYRPDDMTLLLVGDLGELDPEPFFREAFGDMARPAEPLPREPELGAPTLETRSYCVPEPEIPIAIVYAGRLTPEPFQMPTKSSVAAEVPLQLAYAMLNLRFAELAKKEAAPFLAAFAEDEGDSERGQYGLQVFDGSGVGAQAKPERWKEALAACEQELRRAIRFGFQEAELAEVRADRLRGLDEAVRRKDKQKSDDLVDGLVAVAEGLQVMASPESGRDLVKPVIEAATVESCRAALEKAWSEGVLVIAALGNLDLGSEAGPALEQAWKESQAVELEAPAGLEAQSFAYASSPEDVPAAVQRDLVEDLGIHRLRFENGVEVSIKATDFEQGTILMRADLGEGKLGLDPASAPLAFVAGQVFTDCGLGAHSQDELRRLTAGKLVGMGFQVESDRFTLAGGTTPEDLLLECELACAYLTAPGWRSEGLTQFQKQIGPMYESLAHVPSGPFTQSFLPELHGGDLRFGMPPRERVEAVDLEAIRTWLGPELAEAPLSVSFVGDLDPEAVVEAAACTFGRLPERRPLRDWNERRKVAGVRAGLRMEKEIQTETPSSLVAIAFPTTDGRTAATRYALRFLGDVVSDRVLELVREKLGESYSPGAFAQSDLVYEDLGFLWIQAGSEPGQEEAVADACLQVTGALAEKGATEEEIARLREPILNHLRDSRRVNGYWLELLSDAARRPAALQEARSEIEAYESLGAEDLNELARRYLPRERASILIVRPAKAAEKNAQEAGAAPDEGSDLSDG